MKKDTLKEFGKLFYDFAKIIFAVALITPAIKGDSISVTVILLTVVIVAIGTYTINKGAKDE